MKPSKFVPFILTLALAAASQAGAADLKNGEKVYSATCFACHGSGVLNAPRFADKAAWGPRIKKGQPALYTSALKGFNMMPAKGGNASLSDADVKSAVDYMVAKAK